MVRPRRRRPQPLRERERTPVGVAHARFTLTLAQARHQLGAPDRRPDRSRCRDRAGLAVRPVDGLAPSAQADARQRSPRPVRADV